ncbi:MAG TPA: response regulator transcription factor, partial [Planctomycetota bacterium]|nr:response regulator transcription factor [Planctomycetota bacterium]
LVIEDEPDIQTLLRFNLQREGHVVTVAGTGNDGLHELRRGHYDLVLLDLMLPDRDGLEVCRVMRANAGLAGIPIIMLTAKGEESDIVLGLGLGADDYVTKPFRVKELMARIKVRLGRADDADALGPKKRLQVQELVIDPVRHRVTVGEDVAPLTLTEFKLLHFLASHPGIAYGRYDLLDRIGDGEAAVTDRTVDVHVRNLRSKIKPYDRFIETVRGVGYRFCEVEA